MLQILSKQVHDLEGKGISDVKRNTPAEEETVDKK